MGECLEGQTTRLTKITGRFFAAPAAIVVSTIIVVSTMIKVRAWKEGSGAGGQQKMIQNMDGRTLTTGGASPV